MNDAPIPRQPPSFVPTLTEVVQAHAVAADAPAMAASPAPAMPAALSPASLEDLQDQMVQRVMQRVSQSLDLRLREAVAQVVLDQTRGIGPLIAREVQAAVHELVAEALAAEQGR